MQAYHLCFAILISAFWRTGLSQNIRHRVLQSDTVELTRPCTLYKRVRTYENRFENRTWHCLLTRRDGANMVKVPTNLVSADAASGETTLFAEGVTIVNGRARWKDASAVKFGETRQRDRRLFVNGTKSVTMVRVTCGSSQVDKSLADLKSDVFSDTACLKSVLQRCSNNALTISEGPTSATESNGAMDVTISKCGNVDIAETEVTAALTQILGYSPADGNNRYFMYCMPDISGFTGSVGYAYMNGYISVLNNPWCSWVSSQVHEIGHNFNLGHARDENDYSSSRPSAATYGDETGLMGYSYEEDDMDMCYNAPNMYQLGWIKRTSVRHFWSKPYGSFRLRGHTNYTGRAWQAIRLVGTPALNDTYIWYNHAFGINEDTREGQNQVIINTRATGFKESQSRLVAKLGLNGVYNPGNTYYSVRVVSITGGTATVSFGARPTPNPATRARGSTPATAPAGTPTRRVD